jgi:hypothetical protein
MGYVERIQLPVQSFFDIIIDSIGGRKVVISPRLNVFYVATSDDDAVSFALNLSNQLASAGIHHIVYFKVTLNLVNNYTFSGLYAMLIGNIPATVNSNSSGLRIQNQHIYTSGNIGIGGGGQLSPSPAVVPNIVKAMIQNYFRGNNVPVSAGATSLAVTLPQTLPNTNYAVYVTPQWNTSYWITNKTTTGFTINFGTAPATNSALDWVIFF